MEQLIDRVLANRYQIRSLLGRQTGRRTFLAQDLQTERSVVLKLLLFGPDFSWDDLKLFEREAEVLKSIDLPTIPKYLDCFDVDTELGKGFVLVQTYIPAKSLQNWLDAGRTFSESDLISIAKQLLTILEYLHSRQPAVIHRDIKPSNILIGDRSGNSPGQIYLVDFGSVKTAANGSTITVVGTYGYMPPEQFGGQTTPASDLYALGATIICLATGQHPSELPHRDMRIDFVDLVNLAPSVTNWLKSMTEISVDSRLKSASQALLMLDAPSQNNVLTSNSQPFGRSIKLATTDRIFEISIPPTGFSVDLIPMFCFAVCWNGSISWPIFHGLVTFTSGGWMILSFFSLFAWYGITIIWDILVHLFGTQRLRIIDEVEISSSLTMFGLKCFASQTAFREHLDRVELVPPAHTQDIDGNRVTVPAYINIWAGTKTFCLSDLNLTQPEQEWLATELNEWLDLPVGGSGAFSRAYGRLTPRAIASPAENRVKLQNQKMELRKQKKESRKFPPLSPIDTSSNKLEP